MAVAQATERSNMKPEIGDLVKWPSPNKQKPGQWFWGYVVVRKCLKRTDGKDGWRLTVDTGSGGLVHFYRSDLAGLNGWQEAEKEGAGY